MNVTQTMWNHRMKIVVASLLMLAIEAAAMVVANI